MLGKRRVREWGGGGSVSELRGCVSGGGRRVYEYVGQEESEL